MAGRVDLRIVTDNRGKEFLVDPTKARGYGYIGIYATSLWYPRIIDLPAPDERPTSAVLEGQTNVEKLFS